MLKILAETIVYLLFFLKTEKNHDSSSEEQTKIFKRIEYLLENILFELRRLNMKENNNKENVV